MGGSCGTCGVGGEADKWRAVVNVVMNLWIPQNAGNFFNN